MMGNKKQSLKDLKEQSMVSSMELTEAISAAKKLANDFRPMSVVVIGDHPIEGDAGYMCREVDPNLPMDMIAKMTEDANPDVVIIDGDSQNAEGILAQLPGNAVKVFLTSGLNGSFESVREFAKIVVFKPVTVRDLPWLSPAYLRKDT